MTRAEAVKHLTDIKERYTSDRDFSYYGDEYHGLSKEENEAVNVAIKALEQEPKWIPVSERLPEKDKRVIVTGMMWGMWEVNIDSWNGERWNQYGGYVSAWMPLPEPYEEGAEQ